MVWCAACIGSHLARDIVNMWFPLPFSVTTRGRKKTCKLWEITKNVSYISCFLGIMWGSNCIVYSHVPSFAFHFSLPSKIFVRNGPFCWVASCLEISKLEVSSVLPNKKYCWCSNLDCFLRWPGHSCWCGNLVSPATERSAGNIRESKSKVILY